MADENNEDMSMEDILSSIKDILSDEPQIKNAEPVVADEVVAEPVVAEKSIDVISMSEDDVLDLSPSMRIDSPFSSSEDAVAKEVSPNDEFDIIADLPFDDAEDDVSLDSMLDNSDPIFDISDEHVEAEAIETIAEKEVDNLLDSDADSDPFYEDNISTNNYIEPTVEISRIDPVIVHEIEPELTEKLAYQAQEPQSVAQMDSVIVHEFEAEDIVSEPISESISEPVAPKTDSVVDAVDVSANIISNFAKMFAKEETPIVNAEPKVEYNAKVEKIGDASKTIADVVAEVIRSIIGDEVAANWRQGADYSEFAAQEIQYQTKMWLDANLPVLVERIVKQEIERVMAKVGNNQ